jgi:hypothetical protein
MVGNPCSREAHVALATLVISAILALTSCRAAGPPAAYPTVDARALPLITNHLINDTHTERTLSRAAAGDTTERESVVTRIDEIVQGVGAAATLTRVSTGHYAGGDYYDTVIVRRADLWPVREHMAYLQRRMEKRFDYQGGTVNQTNTLGDSVQSFERSYPGQVFGFSEVELLLRSLPYRPGYTAILPLYSEGDDAIEYDSIAVTGTPSGRWTVRFADPAIIATYGIDQATRRIVSYDVINRRTNGRARKIFVTQSR